jgi:uncharacterized protein with NAD-binding domain and iron-sulfur cluster
MARKKVAILGGGLGGLSAAFWLTSTPELRARHDVTIYQQGFRLGGKAATGRNVRYGQRVEEHGLHMLLGFYENAFRTMRRCYSEWQRPTAHPWPSIDDALVPERRITLVEHIDGRREVWTIDAPRLPGRPGMEDGLGLAGDAAVRIDAALTWLDHLLGDTRVHPALAPVKTAVRAARTALRDARVPSFVTTVLAGLVHEAQRVARGIDAAFAPIVRREADLRRPLWLVELALAVLHGWLVDVLPHERPGVDAFSRINDVELRAWLARHGCPAHVTSWAPVKALYDLGFAYERGDASSLDNGRIAAGVGLKIMLRLVLAYKDAPLWRMAGGMGDTLVTPLYEVLRQRGVDVRFFHRAKEVHLASDGRRVEAIDVDVQAETAVTGRAYRPLVRVQGLDCWPSEPLWAQLAPDTPRGDYESASFTHKVRTERLRAGDAFDRVVLAVPKGALRPIVGQLAACDERWRRMLDAVPTVATQAAQLWMTKTTEELGFARAPTVCTSYVEPFDSWADMSEVLDHEAWPAAPDKPRSLQYLCSPMPEPADGAATDPERMREEVRQQVRRWLESECGALWPRFASYGWSALFDPDGGVEAERLKAQYVRANVDPSERYTQSFDGTIDARLHPDNGPRGTGVENLFLAGDHTLTGLNAGSAEAAFESGMLASRAICGEPRVIVDTEV